MIFRELVWNYLLIAPRLLLLVVLAALVRGRLYRQFPIFFGYIISEILQAAVMIPLLKFSFKSKEYEIAYFITLTVSTSFRFGIIHEIFAHLFRNYEIFRGVAKPMFRWATVAFLLVGLLAAFAGGMNGGDFLYLIRIFDRTASVLQCGLLMTLFVFSAQLGLSWRSNVFGIALALGINASADLAASAIRSQTGLAYQTSLNYFVMVAYHCCVLIWILYLLAPERSYAPKALPQHDLESWNMELERLLKP